MSYEEIREALLKAIELSLNKIAPIEQGLNKERDYLKNYLIEFACNEKPYLLLSTDKGLSRLNEKIFSKSIIVDLVYTLRTLFLFLINFKDEKIKDNLVITIVNSITLDSTSSEYSITPPLMDLSIPKVERKEITKLLLGNDILIPLILITLLLTKEDFKNE